MHFNRMLGRIRQDTAEEEKLLSQIQQFNEELQGKIQQATRTLEQRNHELQHVNEALFQSQRQLAQWERMAGMVYQSAAIAHEIGTPLHSIAGYIHLLLIDSHVPDDAKRRLKVIGRKWIEFRRRCAPCSRLRSNRRLRSSHSI